MDHGAKSIIDFKKRKVLQMSKKLNLGCGEFKKEGYVNVDYYSVSKPDVKHDLNKLPYPFKNNEFELIEADHVLEHLENPFNAIKELHRISENSGLIIIKVPHFSRGFSHPEHKRGFDVSLPYYFNPSFKGGYQGLRLDAKKIRLRWFAQPYLKKTVLSAPVFWAARTFGIIVDFFANLSPFFCSRFWCFLVGGFEEVEYHFIVRK